MRAIGSSRGRRGVLVLTTVGSLSAAALSFAHVPGTGNGLPPSTDGPDLRSVKVTRLDLTDGATERALYCFDSDIAAVGAATTYGLQGYDSAKRFRPTSVVRSADPGQERCVVAEFPDGTDISQATTGVVSPGAVADISSKASSFASEPLEGSGVGPMIGATTGPDLVSVEPDGTNAGAQTVLYTYDENLNPNPAQAYDPADFIIYDATGNAHSGTSVVTPSPQGKAIRVNFGSYDVRAASQVYTSRFGAVQDRPMTVGGATGSAFGISGVNGARPSLTSAEPASANTYKLTFSESVNTPVTASFFAITDTGTGFPATGASANGDNTVNVTFPPEVARDPDNIVRIYVIGGGVKSASATPSIVSQAVTSTPNSQPGFTNGPDLLGVSIDATSRTVSYRFDEPVNTDTGSQPAASVFRATAQDGSAQTGASNVSPDGNSYNVIFPTTLTAAVNFELNAGVLEDRTGRNNPIGSVSKDNEQAAPPVIPPVTNPPVANPPVKKTYTTKVSFKRSGKVSKRKYSGKVSASAKTCRFNRTVTLYKRGGKKVTSVKSRSTGSFSFKTRRRPATRMYVKVSTKRTSTATCKAKTSKTIKG